MKRKSQPDENSLQDDLFADQFSEYHEGKDEMNLAEFPIAALTNRIGPEQKTIVYRDQTHDVSTGETVTRQLTITASDRYGLPTATDDEVILGLLQIAKIQGFRSPEMVFTRYQLLQVLGWEKSTKNYRRLEEALKRWVGVTLYYEKAWRDKKTGEWVDADFHILDNVELYKKNQPSSLAPQGNCFIKWNEQVFRNFQAGNLKALDFRIYRELRSTIAKRMYRFLDKRFYHRSNWAFELEHFAFEKIGLSRTYDDIAQLKRRLDGAIRELEAVKFLAKASAKQRYERLSFGKWRIHLSHYVNAKKTAGEVPVQTDVEIRMIEMGINRSQAAALAAAFPEDFIIEKIEFVQYLQKTKGGEAVFDNTAGFLVKAIREDWQPPAGFKSSVQRRRERQEVAEKRARASQRVDLKKQREEEERRERERSAQRVKAYLDTLSMPEREKLIEKALREAGGLGVFKEDGKVAEIYREMCLESYVSKLIGCETIRDAMGE